MRDKNTVLFRMLVLMLVLALCMAGCAGKKAAPEETPPETTASATDPAPTVPAPTKPAKPTELTPHQKLLVYLNNTGEIKQEESSWAFTMRADGKKIIWEYKNQAANVIITLTDGAATQPVTFKIFDMYDAVAEIDVANYSGVSGELTNFQCYVPSMTEPIRSLSISVVKTCFMQAGKAMERSGVNLVDLGFVNYFK
jgi:hypothetical protein